MVLPVAPGRRPRGVSGGMRRGLRHSRLFPRLSLPGVGEVWGLVTHLAGVDPLCCPSSLSAGAFIEGWLSPPFFVAFDT